MASRLRKLKLYGCEFVDSTQLPEQIMKQLRDLQPDVIMGLGGPGTEVTELEGLRNALQSVVGEGLQVEVRTVSSIPVGPGGKLRLSHSDILEDYLEAGTSRGS